MKLNKGLLIIGIIFLTLGYLVVSGNLKSPAKQNNAQSDNKTERDAFVDSVTKLNRARDLNQPPLGMENKSFNLPKETENESFSLTKDAINLSYQVSDSFLDSLHPELKLMYRQKLIVGSQLWLEGTTDSYSTDGVKKQLDGNNLIIEWINWFEKNGKSFENKIF